MIDIGFPIAVLASCIALYGVYLFNQISDYNKARGIWFYSNTLFVIYFAGRCLTWWDGGLGDAMMALYFVMMWISNWVGMKYQPKKSDPC
ncbi:MAG: hypothetical protein WC455_20020 [Dehalococcoidia bacterium]